jgi:hypothetical protein
VIPTGPRVAARAGFRTIPIVLVLGIAAFAVSACRSTSGGASRDWNLTAALPDGTSYPVIVRDTSGRITGVEIDPAGAGDGFTNPAGQPNVVVVPWTGGACDARTEITIGTVEAGPGLALDIRTIVAPRDCDAIGIEHLVRLTASGPVPADRVLVGTVQP